MQWMLLPMRIATNWLVSRSDCGLQCPNCFTRVTTKGFNFHLQSDSSYHIKSCQLPKISANLMVWNKPRWSNHPIFAWKSAKLWPQYKTLPTTNGVHVKRTHTLKHATNGVLTVSGHGQASAFSAWSLDRGPWHGSKHCHCIQEDHWCYAVLLFLILWCTQTGDHPDDLPATWYQSKRMWGSFYFLGYLLEPNIRIWQFNWRVFLLGEIIEASRLSNMKIVCFCKMLFPTQNNIDIFLYNNL